MIQGTGSHVGKSVMVAGLCRALVRRGLKVAPFKPQNMSNNAAVTADGGEIGRAQALQARAARLPPTVDMNPVLLKPEGETGAQVIVQGKRSGTMRAAEYGRRKAELLPRVLESFARVGEGVDIVLVEGAGSPAEVNLRAGDIANMGFAEAADVPVVIVGDIDRGGVIASLVGTHAVLAEADRERIRGFIINKFRGDAGPVLGGAGADRGADGMAVARRGAVVRGDGAPAGGGFARAWRWRGAGRHGAAMVVAVPALPRIANFDDLDPLRAEPGVSVGDRACRRTPIPADAESGADTGVEGDDRRPRVPPRAGLGHRHWRALARGGAVHGPLRRLPDARSDASWIRTARTASRAKSRGSGCSTSRP